MEAVAFEKSVVEAQLATGISRIQFYKVDGTIRDMIVTRDMTIVPIDKHPKNSDTKPNTDTVTVYDVENDAWKSFVLANLIVIDRE